MTSLNHTKTQIYYVKSLVSEYIFPINLKKFCLHTVTKMYLLYVTEDAFAFWGEKFS